ncbi:MAG: fibronectin type III domain-containing protein, partial [Methanomicrobiales archaeon]|nr:fibronectin type III domain-containing protein [Methanomicrobiales archaeon]
MYERKNATCGHAYRWTVVLISLVIFTTLFPAVVNAGPILSSRETVSVGDESIVWGPYLTNTTGNSTTLNWKTQGPSIGRVSYILSGSNSPGISSKGVSEKNKSLIHHVPLNNLEPGKRYSYWIGNNSQNYS